MTRTVFGQVVRTPGVRPLRRRRPDPADALRGVPRQRATRSRRASCRSTSRPASRTASASGSRRAATPARGRARRATSTCWSRCEPDPRFERHGDDLVTRLDVPFTRPRWARRCRSRRSRARRSSSWTPGTQPATVKRLRGHGLPALRGRRPRRPARAGERDDPEPPDRRAARAAPAVRRTPRTARPTPSKDGDGLFDRIRQAFRG